MLKANRIIKTFKNPKTLFIATLALTVLLGSTGYADETNERVINDMSSNISDFLFGSTVRKIALTLGMGAGLFQAFMSGSIRPLLIYGGLGLAVCYLPAMIKWISSVGGGA